MSKRLVVDASVLTAAGYSDHPTSRICRIFLEQIRDICHRIVIYDNFRTEFKRHQSSFGSTWLTEMRKRGRFKSESIVIDDSAIKQLSSHIESSGRNRNEVEKDAHLIAAALATDHVVISLNDRARNDYRQIAGMEPTIRSVAWVNPVTDSNTLEWLRSGAKPEDNFRLGPEE